MILQPPGGSLYRFLYSVDPLFYLSSFQTPFAEAPGAVTATGGFPCVFCHCVVICLHNSIILLFNEYSGRNLYGSD